MLIMTNVRKTFNKGTINEKKALNGIDLTLNDGDFVTEYGPGFQKGPEKRAGMGNQGQ